MTLFTKNILQSFRLEKIEFIYFLSLDKRVINFTVKSPYQPAGDQPKAIEVLTKSILDGNRYQTLEGVTGSGKTHTMARVIENVKMPTIS